MVRSRTFYVIMSLFIVTAGLIAFPKDKPAVPEAVAVASEAPTTSSTALQATTTTEPPTTTTTAPAAPQTTTTTVRPKAPAKPKPAPTKAVATGSVWDRLADCETHGDWAETDAMPTYSGGLGFANQYWKDYGGKTAYPYQASREEQIAVAERILADRGWGAWPACSRKLGLR